MSEDVKLCEQDIFRRSKKYQSHSSLDGKLWPEEKEPLQQISSPKLNVLGQSLEFLVFYFVVSDTCVLLSLFVNHE